MKRPRIRLLAGVSGTGAVAESSILERPRIRLPASVSGAGAIADLPFTVGATLKGPSTEGVAESREVKLRWHAVTQATAAAVRASIQLYAGVSGTGVIMLLANSAGGFASSFGKLLHELLITGCCLGNRRTNVHG